MIQYDIYLDHNDCVKLLPRGSFEKVLADIGITPFPSGGYFTERIGNEEYRCSKSDFAFHSGAYNLFFNSCRRLAEATAREGQE